LEEKEEAADMENKDVNDDIPVEEDLDGANVETEPLEDETDRTAPDDEQQEPGVEQDAGRLKEDYLRLYAEFENYRKRVVKDKEEMARFANEAIIMDLLPSLDNLEIALKHARESEGTDSSKDGLVQGVDMTLRELLRTLEKFGIKQIEAEGKSFDPEFHHAVTQAQRDDMDEGMVVEDLRKGYIYNGKVIRAAMVSVSKLPEGAAEHEE